MNCSYLEIFLYILGLQEIDPLARVVNFNALPRYRIGYKCECLKARYAAWLGANHSSLAVSDSYANQTAVTVSIWDLATKCPLALITT